MSRCLQSTLTASEADRWLIPDSPPVVIAQLRQYAEAACEAMGFPQSAVVDDESPGGVRQTEQALGTVLPGGQGKPPVRPERPLTPGRWLPLDVEIATPGTQQGWGGMSGAGVMLPDGRLIGLVLAAESGHQERRLYLVPLATMFDNAGGFAAALAGQTGHPAIAQAYAAPLWKRVLGADCLGADGLPAPIAALDDLGAFGVKAAHVPGELAYLEYVPRDGDTDLRAALDRAIAEHRMLLMVGGSAAGKSRSAAEAVREQLGDHRLLRVQAGRLAELVEAPLAELAPVVVWLDDVQVYAHQAFRDTLKRLLGSGAVVVGTIRRAEMDALGASGDVRNPTGDALSDEELIERVDWRTAWSSRELDRLGAHVHSSALLAAATSGTSPAAYSVAGPALVKRFKNARSDEDHPVRYWLVRTVLDWHRTGITQPMPIDEATKFALTRANTTGSTEQAQVDDALAHALRAEFTVPPSGRPPALLATDPHDGGLTAHDYILDYDQQHGGIDVPDFIWDCALAHASEENLAAIGFIAYEADELEIAAAATAPLADTGNSDAMYNLGVFLAESDPVAARGWYERAVAAGHTRAMNNLGVLLKDSDPVAARGWYERAAEAGHVDPMFNLGVLLEASDPVAARGWYERAAEAGDAVAMYKLGLLLEDREPEIARGWYERAAEARHVGAMFKLGLLLEDREPEIARGWYERAAEAGHAGAMLSLGALLKGSDPEGARGWLERAAEAGNSDAMYNLGVFLAESDPVAARGWYERAVAAGHTRAMNNLGVLLKDSDPVAARGWYERAAEAGHVDPMFNLGVLLEASDPVAARGWYERAAEAGDAVAMYKLGLLLEDREPEIARGWYERAAEAGHAGAMLRLGALLKGSDPEGARGWLERAAGRGLSGPRD